MKELEWYLCPSLYDPCCDVPLRIKDNNKDKTVSIYCDCCGDAIEKVSQEEAVTDWNIRKRAEKKGLKDVNK